MSPTQLNQKSSITENSNSSNSRPGFVVNLQQQLVNDQRPQRQGPPHNRELQEWLNEKLVKGTSAFNQKIAHEYMPQYLNTSPGQLQNLSKQQTSQKNIQTIMRLYDIQVKNQNMILNLLSTLVVDQAGEEKKETAPFVHQPQAVHSTEMVDNITVIVEKLHKIFDSSFRDQPGTKVIRQQIAHINSTLKQMKQKPNDLICNQLLVQTESIKQKLDQIIKVAPVSCQAALSPTNSQVDRTVTQHDIDIEQLQQMVESGDGGVNSMKDVDTEFEKCFFNNLESKEQEEDVLGSTQKQMRYATYVKQILAALTNLVSEQELENNKRLIQKVIKSSKDSSSILIESNLPKKHNNPTGDNFRGSKFRGPSKNRKKWQVMKMVNKQTVRIGTVASEREAARIYDFLVILTEGLTAKTNFNYTAEQLQVILQKFYDQPRDQELKNFEVFYTSQEGSDHKLGVGSKRAPKKLDQFQSGEPMRGKLSTKSMEEKSSAMMTIQIPTNGNEGPEEKINGAEQKMEDQIRQDQR